MRCNTLKLIFYINIYVGRFNFIGGGSKITEYFGVLRKIQKKIDFHSNFIFCLKFFDEYF